MRWLIVGWMWAALAGCAATGTGAPNVAALASAADAHSAATRVAAPPDTAADKRALFAEAHRRLDDGDFAGAAPLLEALVDRYPELGDYCLHDLARVELRRGNFGRAAELWGQLASSYPQSVHAPAAALERGRIQRWQGNWRDARPLLILARKSGDTEVAQAATFELAEMDAVSGNTARAHRRFTAVRRMAPGSPLGNAAREWVAALRGLDPALAPRGAALVDELRLLIRERDYAAARATAEIVLSTAASIDRAEILRLRADAEYGMGDLQRALATLQRIARDYPDSPAAPEALFRYASLLWNRDRDEDAMRGFLDFRRRYPRHERLPEVLYAIARILHAQGEPEKAIATYAELARIYPRRRLAHEARWRIGWIRYEQRRWREAARAFARLAATGPIERTADGHYWQARALEHAGNRSAAAAIYRRILAQAPASYYAHWAEQRLGQRSAVRPHSALPGVAPRERTVTPVAAEHIGAGPPSADAYHLIRARELQAADLRALARDELQAFERANRSDPQTVRFLLRTYRAVDGYRDAIRLLRRSRGSNPELLYPLAFWPLVTRYAAGRIDPLFVLALMRQESLYDPRVRSRADARGLMQLLPSTAARVAQELGRPAPDLFEPETNIALGVAYLDGLLQRYGGDPVKALAAYNGGEDAVAKWERGNAHREPDEFAESITYRETRDYVKRVLANYRRYRELYASP